MKRIHFKLTVVILAGGILMSQTACIQETGSSAPEDALFCDNLADQVQNVEQLHVESGTDSATETQSDWKPISYETTYAMWFPVMGYADTLRGKSEAEFRSLMRQRFQNAAAMGINTVYLHVRAYQDAYYLSDLFPLGAYADPALSFDPLTVMLEEAHALNLSAHAWINPLRCPSDTTMQKLSDTYQIRQWYDDPSKNGTYLVQVENNWWLNPAYPEVRQFIANGVEEIVTQYPVDGIHLDDYFYPTTDQSFDAAAFAESGSSDLSEFRLEQTSTLIQLLYKTTKAANSSLVFSISPQGTMQGNYNSQFADVRRWCSESGFCDVIIPQVYYGFENETAPFTDTVSIWTEAVTEPSVSLLIGICTHKLGNTDPWAGSGSTEWQKHLDIPERQVEFLLALDSITGIAIYDYDSTFAPETAAEAMAQQVEAIGALLRKS